jgi:hypothetical protein
MKNEPDPELEELLHVGLPSSKVSTTSPRTIMQGCRDASTSMLLDVETQGPSLQSYSGGFALMSCRRDISRGGDQIPCNA